MTTEVKISTLGAELVLPADSLTNGTANAEVHFTFDETWATYDGKTAVFSNELQTVQAEINGEGIALIPPVILATLWRFVSVAVSAEGVGAYSPFVRIGQVLPSGKDGQGGQFVTFEQLQQILLGYVKAEDLGIYATKEELEAARAALAAEIAGKADKAAVDAQEAEIETLTRAVGANTTAIAGNTTAIATKADKTELAGYWSKAEIGLQTSGDGTKYLADDGTYKPVHGGGGDEKTFIAEYNVTTAQEIIAFLDAAKEPFAPMLVKRGTDYYTVTTAAKQDADKVIIRTFATLSGNYYMFTYTITGGTWASSSYGFQKLLESGTNIKTINGQSLLGSGDIPIQGGAQVQANWDETDDTSPAYIQNKPTIPDVSGLATKTELQTAQDALQTEIDGKADKSEIPDISGLASKTELTAAQETLQTGIDAKADKTTVDAISETVAVNTAAIETKASAGDLTALQGTVATNTAAIAANTAAIDGKADKTALDEYATDADLSAARSALQADIDTKADESSLADYWSKTDIELETAGTGTLFLADDGTYKPAAGDPPDLSAYLTKTEAAGEYATKTELAGKADAADIPDVSGFETATHAAETYATKTELADKADSATVTALSGVVTGHTAEIAALQTGKADKTEIPDVSGFETTAHAAETYATKTELSTGLASKADINQIITITTGDGSQFLANDGTYKTVQVDPPDLTPYLTKSEAGETYATKNELDAKADRTQLQGYLTRVEASETYETIARASKIKSLTAAGHAVTVTDEGLANVGGTKVTKASTSPQIGVSDVSISVQQILPATEDSTTGEGETLPITYTATTSGALTEYSNFTIDGVPIATKNDIPDVSHFATTDYVQNTFETSAHADATYSKISDTAQVHITHSVRGSTGAQDYTGKIYQPDTGGSDKYVEITTTVFPDMRTYGSGVEFKFSPTVTTPYPVTVPTYADMTYELSLKADATAITDMATETWVQQYIASLDANNTGY